MKTQFAIGGGLLVLSAVVGAAIASAQSAEIVFINMEADAAADAGTASDAGPPSDMGQKSDAAKTGGIIIQGIRDDIPEVPVDTTPRNPRKTLEEAIITRVKWCVGHRTVDPSDANTEFLYLVRKDRPNATLTSVTNDMGMHVSKFAVDVLRRSGHTGAMDVEDQRRLFIECVEVVPLPVRPVVTERLSFRLKAGALSLLVRDLQWRPL